MVHILALAEVNKDIILNSFHVRLALDPGNEIADTETDLFSFFQNEIRQTVDGYIPASYTPSSSAYDTVSERDFLETETVNFTEGASGTGYSFNRIVVWYKGTGTANKPVTAVNTTDNTLSVINHGLTAGQKVYVRSSAGGGGLPGGLAINSYYYAGDLTTSTLKLYSDEALTTLIDLTSAGSGTIDLCWANGVPWVVNEVSTITVNPSGTQPVSVRLFNKSAA